MVREARKKIMELTLVQKICLVFFLFAWVVKGQPNVKVFNVLKYGAVRNGRTDSSKAFTKAWKDACSRNKGATLLVPQGSYYAGLTEFSGPCKGPMDVQIRGVLKAPTGIGKLDDAWFKFEYLNGLTVGGGGTFDGQGASTWPYNDCSKNRRCKIPPHSISFFSINDSAISRISSVNSKGVHINVYGCKNVSLHSVRITAPEDSPNTDGIHIGTSSLISISHSNIGTGDDCISLSHGSKDITVTNVTCGPGHGISVGSLGNIAEEDNVTGLLVKNCTFIHTSNGARIKTWASRYSNLVQDIRFEDIYMNNVSNPIVIDQEYCPSNMCNKKSTSNVQIKDVHYRNIWGSSSSKLAVKLVCSRRYPCQGIELNRIYLPYTGKDGPVSASCSNARGSSSGKQLPPSCLK